MLSKPKRLTFCESEREKNPRVVTYNVKDGKASSILPRGKAIKQ